MAYGIMNTDLEEAAGAGVVVVRVEVDGATSNAPSLIFHGLSPSTFHDIIHDR
jgi:hypothetical protein